MEGVTQLSNQVTELSYALDTFYFLVMGALVMWMAAGFTMLESGLVRAKNTTEILTKNVGLYAIACIMYMLCGYSIMYPGEVEGAVFCKPRYHRQRAARQQRQRRRRRHSERR